MTAIDYVTKGFLRCTVAMSCLLALAAHPLPSRAQVCVGDCDGDGRVLVHELILGVNILLGERPVSACPIFADDEGNVTVSQLVRGVSNSLGVCAATHTPTQSPTPTPQPSTPTATPSTTPSL